MKKLKGFFCFIVIICGVFILSGLSAANVSELKKIQVLEGYGKFPLYFIKNQGQVDQKVKFYERGRGHSIFFTSKEIVFSFYSTKDKSPSIVKLTPLGMRKDVDIVAEDHQDGKINYFNGKDSKKWKTNIPTYRTVVYREAYPGIDIKFYGNNQQLEYDILVKKGGDPSQVKFQYSGIENFEVTDKGDLCISLKDGGKVIQKKPIVYQEIEGNRNYLTGKFKLHQIPLSSDSSQSDVKKSTPIKNFVYSFEVASYNKNIPLIIDPVLVYSTYLGGTGDDAMYSDERMTIDSNGNVYITGSTESSDFPTKNPLYPELWGPWDSFVTKINAAGTELVFSTYIGGSNRDTIKDITIDSDGNIFITGKTSSDDFPIKNALFPELWGNYDGFVTRIRAAGDSLKFSTYLGGNGSDSGKGIALDPDKNIYVTGQTFSADFPTKNPIYPELWGQSDAFVIKFESDGSEIYYSTYLGGSGRENDSGGKIAVDNNGNVYVTGTTRSSDFPTVNTLYSNLWGYEDAFVTKINSAGTSVLYSTYLGGSNQEWGMDIALDSYGNAYVTGTTFSDDFPTKNALYPNLFGGSDAFVTKIKPDGSALEYSTYLGGNNYEYGNAIAVDTSGAVYVTGSTSSDDYPLENPLPVSTHLQGVNDTYVTKFSPGGTSITFSTYLGGSADDFGYDIAVDSSNKVYVSGITRSSNFPTESPLFSEIEGGSDAFVAKIDIESTEYFPKIYGLFIGSKHTNLRADESARRIHELFSKLPNVVYAKPIIEDMLTGGILQSRIEAEIDKIKEKIQPGDILFLYSVSHGGSALLGDETTINIGDEYLLVGSAPDPYLPLTDQMWLTDDELYSALNGINDVNKWVVIDACHSGGFWGNDNSEDKGDLEKLTKTAFLASAKEDQNSAYGDDGHTLFSYVLNCALSDRGDGILRADSNEDTNITLEEIYEYVDEYAKRDDFPYRGEIVFEQELGDPMVFSPDMWAPVMKKTVDFNSVLITPVPSNSIVDPEIYPVADANGQYTGTVGMPILFNANSSYDLDGEILSYEWDFDNDGIYDEIVNIPTTTHSYSSEYTGLVKLRITDNDGLTAIDSAFVEVMAIEKPGDLDSDGDIDTSDLYIFRSTLGKCTGDEGFIADADYDEDGCITYADYRIWYGYYRAAL